MKIAFAGTPEFAAPILRSLLDDPRLSVAMVYAQPARPSGRGMEVRPGPVEQLALDRGITVRTPASWNAEDIDALRSSGADVLVTAAYGLLLPDDALSAAPRGALNVHGSILPRWRGAAPIQRAIQAGDPTTGITLFRILPGPVDSGPVVASFPLTIDPSETSASLSLRLSKLASDHLADELLAWSQGLRPEIPQPVEGVTRARKLKKDESLLDWHFSAERLDRSVRAFTPWPGARISSLRILELRPIAGTPATHAPGTVLSMRPLVVACGKNQDGTESADKTNAVELVRVQRDGGKPQSGAEWANGSRLRIGDAMP